MASILEVMGLDSIYADELLNMKKKYDEGIKQETIQRQVKNIVGQVRKQALQGKTFYSMDEHELRQMPKFLDETVDVLREVFPDSNIEYKKAEVNLPSRNPNVVMTQIITTLKIDWSGE
jgi:hypothetical protein